MLKGKFKGAVIGSAVNMLTGSYENDKIFAEGDKALIIISYRDSEILSAAMIDHYRLNYEIILAVIFAALLIITAGKTGFRSLLSFIITILAVWKAVVPLYLKGIDPIASGAVFITLLSVIIIAMVYGFDRRCFAATAGVMSGVMVALVFGAVFTNIFKIHGAVMSMSESLLYCGYGNLNLTSIFTASIFIGSSGAMMDLAVDITLGYVRDNSEKARHNRQGAYPFGYEHRQGCHGNYKHNPAAGLLGKLHCYAHGIYGAGHSSCEYPQLQIRCG